MLEVDGWIEGTAHEGGVVIWVAGDPEGKTKWRQGGGFFSGGEEMIDGTASLGFDRVYIPSGFG